MVPRDAGDLARTVRRLLEQRVPLGDSRSREWQITLLWAAAIGVVGALAAGSFHLASEALQHLVTGQPGGLVDSFNRIPPWARFAIPVLGGALAGAVLHFGMRLNRSQHSSDYMEAVVVGEGNISFRASMTKSLSALFSGASGASIGREGPMVQLSAMLSSLLGRARWLPVLKRREIVACGVAAGIASAYNAPIAGAFFVSEIILGSTAMESFGPLVVSTVAATLVTRGLMGPNALYPAKAFALVSRWEVIPYLALGIACGLLAPLYLRLLRRSERLFARLPFHLITKLALGGAVVGGLAILRPEVCGNGQSVVMSLLREPWTWKAALVIVAFKVVATAATFGSGAVGGVFTPTLLTGAAFGHLFGVGMAALFPAAHVEPRAYALVGMGAFLAASTGAPIMALIMLFELTLDYAIILPLMLAVVVGYFVCRTMERQFLYGEALERKGASATAALLAGMRTMDLAQPNPVRVSIAAKFREVAQAFLHHRFNYLYVVDDQGLYVGAISLHDIKEYLDERRDIEAVIAGDLMRQDFPSLTAHQSLVEAVEAFEHTRSERIPVVESRERPRLLGSLSKTDLLRHMMQTPTHSPWSRTTPEPTADEGALRPAPPGARRGG